MKERLSLILRFCFIIGCAFLCLWVWSSAYFYMKIAPIDPLYALESTVTFGISLFLWIAGLSIIAVILFHELLVRYVEQRERAYRFKQTMSQMLSHKLGNFLVTQKVNLSILQEHFSQDVLRRASQSLTVMESQFKDIMKVIEEFRPEYVERKVVDLRDIVLSVVDEYPEDVIKNRVRLRIQKAPVFVNFDEARIFAHLIIDNALKYSDKVVYIRTGIFRKDPYLIVVNDILRGVATHGAGMGLIIAENVATSLHVSFRTFSRKNFYFSISLWPRKRWFE